MSATSTRLLAWLRRHGVTSLCLLAVVGISLSLTRQSVDLLRVLRSEPLVEAGDAPREQQPLAIEQLAGLFGTPSRTASDLPPPTTNQQMTLLASFVNPDAQRSAAIIQVAGSQPKRIEVGGEVNASTRLKEVHPDHVILERGGAEESLNFPVVRIPSTQRHVPEYAADQLEQLQDEDVQALQERIDTLQERLESDGSEPLPTDTPGAEDAP